MLSKFDQGFALPLVVWGVIVFGGSLALWTRVAVKNDGTVDAHSRMEADVRAILAAATMFSSDHGRLPIDLDELEHPPLTADGRQPRYLANAPLDPWTNEYYNFEVSPGGVLRVWSFGADMEQGGTGFDVDYSMEVTVR